ncbi:uncharacterized protein LOC133185525 isoform X2 [Saccostrea echinata]|uniref:uncharacterized protein LOC133185525 isoform X2 n=1 Tax=Saccostrea echinata TaxID=191078 RepID=UPI002A7FB4EA|nr:uncharacterized protein LOC133185525 isoform X2 [Saccostrea echinata]
MEYQFNPSRKYQGLALVITNFTKPGPGPLLERGGAKIDVKYMKKTFKRLGFKVVSYENVYTSDFERILSETSTDPAVKDFDCFVFAISTHGLELEEVDKERGFTVREHAVQMFDGEYYSTSEILEYFSYGKCKALRGKPKLFFIQACRIPETEASEEQRLSGIGFDHGTSAHKYSGGENEPGGDKTDYQGSDDISEKELVIKEEDVSDTDIEEDEDKQGGYRPPPPVASGQKQSEENNGSEVQANRLGSGDVVDPPRGIRLSQEKNIITPVPCHNDMLVMFASPQGLYAVRNLDMGSYLLKYLYEAVEQFYGNGKLENNKTNFLEVLRHVTEKMTSKTYFGSKQYTNVPCIVHKLSKDIVFTQGETMAHNKFMEL